MRVSRGTKKRMIERATTIYLSLISHCSLPSPLIPFPLTDLTGLSPPFPSAPQALKCVSFHQSSSISRRSTYKSLSPPLPLPLSPLPSHFILCLLSQLSDYHPTMDSSLHTQPRRSHFYSYYSQIRNIDPESYRTPTVTKSSMPKFLTFRCQANKLWESPMYPHPSSSPSSHLFFFSLPQLTPLLKPFIAF